MSLVKCPECGKEVSDMAEKCPQCGIDIQNNIGNNSKVGKKRISKIERLKLKCTDIFILIRLRFNQTNVSKISSAHVSFYI